MTAQPRLSVVVPMYDEQDSVPALVDAVRGALGPGSGWELILVDDGSHDRTAAVCAEQAAADPRVRLVRLARNYGQTQAMQAGFDHARGEVVVSMDGDLQNDPADIPMLVARIDEGYDLVAGYRLRRQDKVVTRKIPSWFANRIIRRLTGVQIRDNGCSLKAYRSSVLARMRLYSEQHRFIPAVAASLAGARITEVPVRHHARRFGRSKYGLSRVFKVLGDLLTILMIRKFRERPLVLFGAGAAGALAVGVAFSAASLVALGFRPLKAEAWVLPGAALAWLALAVFLLMLGLVAEAALRTERDDQRDDLPLVFEVRT